jgi:hypothetical protein
MESWVDTDTFGLAIDASPSAATLFNLSVRGLTGRRLSLFFMDRAVVMERFRAVAAGLSVASVIVTLRPREKKPKVVRIELELSGDIVRWYVMAIAVADAEASGSIVGSPSGGPDTMPAALNG